MIDYLKLAEGERLTLLRETHLHTQGQTSIKEWQIVDSQGTITGGVTLRDRMNSRRSYSGEYRLTQRDRQGDIVLDRLI
ncbi:hypothetical protein EFZ10_07685 [Tatumella sp. TA1]|uniref:hypothetical protein n=1 Tax=Rosenbergiella collisarenosi TaxID=1544695 RepID=UPI0012FDCAF1|nr:hypothetical protein [Rosenbergiella collisarenosi]MBT0720916.1 hypothetical protein [Rosenbergiella collisarenosi]QGX91517.1 hypothetical protein EFZ10_07685 [Tatumella sp. TA1]